VIAGRENDDTNVLAGIKHTDFFSTSYLAPCVYVLGELSFDEAPILIV